MPKSIISDVKDPVDVSMQSGWASGLLTKILANISVDLFNISLTYIDGDAYASLLVDSIRVYSVNQLWKEGFSVSNAFFPFVFIFFYNYIFRS